MLSLRGEPPRPLARAPSTQHRTHQHINPSRSNSQPLSLTLRSGLPSSATLHVVLHHVGVLLLLHGSVSCGYFSSSHCFMMVCIAWVSLMCIRPPWAGLDVHASSLREPAMACVRLVRPRCAHSMRVLRASSPVLVFSLVRPMTSSPITWGVSRSWQSTFLCGIVCGTSVYDI